MKRRIGGVGRKAEERTAKRRGGKLTANSGAGGSKGDYRLDGEHRSVCENKSTTAMSLSLKYEWVAKVAREAACTGRIPQLSFQFTDETGRPRQYGAWVAVPEAMLDDLLTKAGAALAALGVDE